jgi:hypothetical protein
MTNGGDIVSSLFCLSSQSMYKVLVCLLTAVIAYPEPHAAERILLIRRIHSDIPPTSGATADKLLADHEDMCKTEITGVECAMTRDELVRYIDFILHGVRCIPLRRYLYLSEITRRNTYFGGRRLMYVAEVWMNVMHLTGSEFGTVRDYNNNVCMDRDMFRLYLSLEAQRLEEGFLTSL